MLFHLYLLGKVSKKKLLGTARVLAYGTVVTAGLGALTVRSAVADVSHKSLQIGRQLADLQDLLHGAQEFRLNGQSIYFSSSKSDLPLKTVLDRFEDHCNRNHAFDANEWKELSDMKGKDVSPPPSSGISKLGVFRQEDPTAHDGAVMCFTKEAGATGMLAALETFEATGDLHNLGDLRYVHALQKNGQTLVQTVWTDGSFNVRSIMGTPGQDSIGSDFVNLPRPIDSRRVMTADAVGTPYSARIYESTSAPDKVLAAYANKMFTDGWSSVTSPDVGFGKTGFDGRYFMRPETMEQAVISVSTNKDNGKTMAVVASVGGTPTTKDLKTVAQ